MWTERLESILQEFRQLTDKLERQLKEELAGSTASHAALARLTTLQETINSAQYQLEDGAAMQYETSSKTEGLPNQNNDIKEKTDFSNNQSELNTKIEEILTKLSEVSKKVEGVSYKQFETETQLQKISNEHHLMNKRLEDVYTARSESDKKTKASASKIDKSLNVQRRTLAELKGEIHRATQDQTKMKKLSKDVGKLKNRMNELDNKYNKMEEEEEIKLDISMDLTQKVANIQSELQYVKSEVQSYKSGANDIQLKVDSLGETTKSLSEKLSQSMETLETVSRNQITEDLMERKLTDKEALMELIIKKSMRSVKQDNETKIQDLRNEIEDVKTQTQFLCDTTSHDILTRLTALEETVSSVESKLEYVAVTQNDMHIKTEELSKHNGDVNGKIEEFSNNQSQVNTNIEEIFRKLCEVNEKVEAVSDEQSENEIKFETIVNEQYVMGKRLEDIAINQTKLRTIFTQVQKFKNDIEKLDKKQNDVLEECMTVMEVSTNLSQDVVDLQSQMEHVKSNVSVAKDIQIKMDSLDKITKALSEKLRQSLEAFETVTKNHISEAFMEERLTNKQELMELFIKRKVKPIKKDYESKIQDLTDEIESVKERLQCLEAETMD